MAPQPVPTVEQTDRAKRYRKLVFDFRNKVIDETPNSWTGWNGTQNVSGTVWEDFTDALYSARTKLNRIVKARTEHDEKQAAAAATEAPESTTDTSAPSHAPAGGPVQAEDTNGNPDTQPRFEEFEKLKTEYEQKVSTQANTLEDDIAFMRSEVEYEGRLRRVQSETCNQRPPPAGTASEPPLPPDQEQTAPQLGADEAPSTGITPVERTCDGWNTEKSSTAIPDVETLKAAESQGSSAKSLTTATELQTPAPNQLPATSVVAPQGLDELLASLNKYKSPMPGPAPSTVTSSNQPESIPAPQASDVQPSAGEPFGAASARQTETSSTKAADSAPQASLAAGQLLQAMTAAGTSPITNETSNEAEGPSRAAPPILTPTNYFGRVE